MKRGVHTTIRISTGTYNKLHYLKFPYETHDETLERILGEYPDMAQKVKLLEDSLIDKHRDISA